MMRSNERGVPRTAEVPPLGMGVRRSLPTGAWAAGGALLALAVACGFAAQRQLASLISELDARALAIAPGLLERAIEQHKSQVLGEVRLLSEDSRVRTTVMTAQFSEATVRDILSDLRQATDATVMAVLDPRGKVLAAAGRESMRSLDLGGTPLVTEGLAKPVAQVWTLPDQVLVVGLAPIRAGGQVAALLLTGRELGATILNPIEQSAGVAGALLVRQTIVARSAGAAPLDQVIKAAAELDDGRHHLLSLGGEHLVRVSPTSPSAGAGRAVWVRGQSQPDPRLFRLRALGWMPFPLVALSLALAYSLYRRRSNGELA
jgi:Double sensory domain of two-component sensor kinase